MNEEQIENRFGYLRDLTDEELKKEKEELIEDLESLNKMLNDKKITQAEADIRSDIVYTKDKLEYIEKLISETKASKRR